MKARLLPGEIGRLPHVLVYFELSANPVEGREDSVGYIGVTLLGLAPTHASQDSVMEGTNGLECGWCVHCMLVVLVVTHQQITY